MTDSQLYSGSEAVEESEDGFVPAREPDPSALDSEVDFDDEGEDLVEDELIEEGEAGNAEGAMDAHLDDPERVADDETY